MPAVHQCYQFYTGLYCWQLQALVRSLIAAAKLFLIRGAMVVETWAYTTERQLSPVLSWP